MLVDPCAGKMLDGGRYLNPRVTRLFPDRTNRPHRMRFVEKTDWHSGHVRVLHTSHEYGRAAFWAEEPAKLTPKVGGPIKLLRLALNGHLIVRPISSFTKWRPGSLLAGQAMADYDGDGRARHGYVQLTTLA